MRGSLLVLVLGLVLTWRGSPRCRCAVPSPVDRWRDRAAGCAALAFVAECASFRERDDVVVFSCRCWG